MTINVQVKPKNGSACFKWEFNIQNEYLELGGVFDNNHERILFISGLEYKTFSKYPSFFLVYIHNIKEYEKCIRVLNLAFKNSIHTYDRKEVIKFFS
jgi:hypothetical protein